MIHKFWDHFWFILNLSYAYQYFIHLKYYWKFIKMFWKNGKRFEKWSKKLIRITIFGLIHDPKHFLWAFVLQFIVSCDLRSVIQIIFSAICPNLTPSSLLASIFFEFSFIIKIKFVALFCGFSASSSVILQRIRSVATLSLLACFMWFGFVV